MIRLFCRFKYTICMSLVFAALITWTAWDGQWWRIGGALMYGIMGAAAAAVPDLWRRRNRKRGGSHGWR